MEYLPKVFFFRMFAPYVSDQRSRLSKLTGFNMLIFKKGQHYEKNLPKTMFIISIFPSNIRYW